VSISHWLWNNPNLLPLDKSVVAGLAVQLNGSSQVTDLISPKDIDLAPTGRERKAAPVEPAPSAMSGVEETSNNRIVR